MWPHPRSISSAGSRATLALTIALALALGSAGIGAGTARAVVPGLAGSISTTTTLDAPAGPVFGTVTLTAHVDPAPHVTDGFTPAVMFEVDGNQTAPAPIQADGSASADISLAPGTYSLVAVFGGLGDYAASSSEPATVTVGVATTTTLTSSLEPAISTQQITLTASVSNTLGATLTGGTLTVTDGATGPTLGVLDVGPAATTFTIVTKLPVGVHHLVATYSGHGTLSSSTANLTQTIDLDQAVDAGSFSRSYSTFYPVRDSYRDTLAIRGTLREPATVTIRIYSVATGKRVWLTSLGTTSGAYSATWNGRTSTGTLRAAGKYRIVQTLVDTGGNQLSATLYVTLSHKKLYWTTTTKSLNGEQFTLKGDPGDGSVSTAKSAYSRGVRLSSGHAWVAVSYSFGVPSATAYGNVKFKVLGRSPNGRGALIAIWNPSLGSYLDANDYDAAKLVGPGYAWYSTTAPLSSHKGGGRVRAMVYVEYSGGGRVFDVAKVAVTYRYAVLK
jgi:hypothetical protein